MKGEPNCGNVAVDGVVGVAANCEVSASAPGPEKRLIKIHHKLTRSSEDSTTTYKDLQQFHCASVIVD